MNWPLVSANALEPRGAHVTVGVEEEFFLVDPASRRTAPMADAVRKHVGRLPDGAKVQPELLSTQVEFSTGVCTSMADLREQLIAGRRELAAAAGREGLRVVSSGTAVLSSSGVPVTDGDRFARIASRYRGLVTDYEVSGCHVHVGVPDRETAIAVVNHLSVWLPTLLALSANSPFDDGRDTGYASWRMVLQARFPGSGLTPWFGSATEHDLAVDHLVDMGVLIDNAMTFWFARPSPHYPTVEVRVADAAASVADAVQQAELTVALVSYALAELAEGREARPVPEHRGKAAVWAAARYGIDGTAIDLRTGEMVPGRWLLNELTELLGLPHAHVRQRIAGDPTAAVDALMEKL